jgi:GNAT superfamily N-acetyltransferase
MPPQLEIREAAEEDAAALATLLTQLGYPGAEPFIGNRITQQRSHPDALMLVACAGRQPLGFISLHFIPQVALAGDFCRISYFCVEEDARALGLGALLEQRAEEEARKRGCDRIEVHCHERRSQAHRFYHRQGYEESPKYLMKVLG